jgi:putative heme iron utilization protein
MSENDKIDPIRTTDDDARQAVKTLVRTARYAALATLDPATGAPVATRVATATTLNGEPLILVSSLTPHTAAMLHDARISLLVGEPGKGDPLAHPRVTLQCRARKLDRQSEEGQHARQRYLNRHPKAALYADFGDFSFFELGIDSASFNGGFGKAYRMDRADVVANCGDIDGFRAMEASAIAHMNGDHSDAVAVISQAFAKGKAGDPWTVCGIDAEGMDLALGDRAARVWYPAPLAQPQQLRKALADLTAAGRAKLNAEAS